MGGALLSQASVSSVCCATNTIRLGALHALQTERKLKIAHAVGTGSDLGSVHSATLPILDGEGHLVFVCPCSFDDPSTWSECSSCRPEPMKSGDVFLRARAFFRDGHGVRDQEVACQ